jgi:hypothetical protein
MALPLNRGRPNRGREPLVSVGINGGRGVRRRFLLARA